MSDRQLLREQLYGVHSHLHTLHALEGLDPAVAGASVEGSPHTIFQILHHMIYWQDVALLRIRGEDPPDPESAAEGWAFPPAPEDESDQEAAVASLAEGLRALESVIADPDFDLDRVIAARRDETARRQILMVQGHNSYHLGQIVQLRKQLGSWPPPRGADTW